MCRMVFERLPVSFALICTFLMLSVCFLKKNRTATAFGDGPGLLNVGKFISEASY